MNGFIIGHYLERVNHFLERVIIIFVFYDRKLRASLVNERKMLYRKFIRIFGLPTFPI
jgi:hypothetical protein